jgi:hypothetical protein
VSKILNLKPLWLIVIYVVLDILCIGMGMGVPVFCILLGFPAGWLIVGYITSKGSSISGVHKSVLSYSFLAALVTLIGMLLLWGPATRMLFTAGADLANFGIPMILYQPMASFIGWLVLMVLISPFLQLMAMIFGAYLALMGWFRQYEATAHAELQTSVQ